MSTDSDRIVRFLQLHGFARPPYADFSWRMAGYLPALHWRYQGPITVEAVADDLRSMEGSAALRLDRLVSTPAGQAILLQAVRTVIPPMYKADVDLLFAALKLVGELQHSERQPNPTQKVLIGAAAVVVLVVLIRWAQTSSVTRV